MNSEEIKAKCEVIYEQIKVANEQLKELRAICKHENTFEGNYEYRVAATFPAVICSDCGAVVKSLMEFYQDQDNMWHTTNQIID